MHIDFDLQGAGAITVIIISHCVDNIPLKQKVMFSSLKAFAIVFSVNNGL